MKLKKMVEPLVMIPIGGATLAAISGSGMSAGFRSVSEISVAAGMTGKIAKNWIK